MAKIMIALGGNALGDDPASQREAIRQTAQGIVKLVQAGHRVAISHGNGPQVGMINHGLELAAVAGEGPTVPLPECGAMSQGYIGFHLQMELGNALKQANLPSRIATVITQCVVDANDPAFDNPTKFIGRFFTAPEGKVFAEKWGYTFKEDSGRGHRRVVPSPEPKHVVEADIIADLLASDVTVIAGGGGGIPVVEVDGRLEPVAAVIDKDHTSCKLAEELGADIFLVLTGVDQVAIGFGTPDETWLTQITLAQADEYIAAGEFPAGSMLPKVEAAKSFVESGPGRSAIITSIDAALDAVEGAAGTRIVAG